MAVLPWGSTEAYNYHLPYATDTIQCNHVAAESARRAWAEREWPRVTDAITDLLHDLAADLDDLYVDPDA